LRTRRRRTMFENEEALSRRAAKSESGATEGSAAAGASAIGGAHGRALRSGLTRGLAVLFGTLWLTACAVGPNYKEPKVPAAEKFEGTTLTTYSQEESIGRFWEQFNDDTLNTLVGEALASNHDLRI